MKIACPSCSAKYSIADEKVQNRLAKIRCRKCGTTIVIDGKASPPTVQSGDASVHPSVPASTGAGDEYTVDVGENDQRSMTVAQIVEAYNAATITAETYVWKDGMPDWIPLADVPEINEALHAAAAAAANEPESPAFATSSIPTPDVEMPSARSVSAQGYGTTPARTAASAGLSGLGATNTSRSSGLGGATDLFGGIDVAGSESDVTTSALDGGGGVSAATGARNESSVLFSLSALTAAQEDKKESPGSNEDSGLIDLAALTSSAASAPAHAYSGGLDLGSAPLAPSPLGGAPLMGGTAAPLGIDAMPMQTGGNKNGLFIGGGIVVAVLLAGLFAVLLKDDPQPVAAAPTATVFIPATAPVATVASGSESDEAAKDNEAANADDEAANADDEGNKTAQAPARTPPPTTRKRSSGSTGGSTKKSPSSGSGSSSDESSKKKPAAAPKKKSTCNCAPSDLMCAMKCSAK